VRERAAARVRAVGAAEEARGGAAAQTVAVVAREEEETGAVGVGGANAIAHTSPSRCRIHTGAVDVPAVAQCAAREDERSESIVILGVPVAVSAVGPGVDFSGAEPAPDTKLISP
jgi:hypothetical protein